MKHYSYKAFTLIEVIIVCMIFSLILESVYFTLFVGQKSWTNYSSTVLFKQNARRALMSMTNELREAKDIFIIKDEHEVSISFDRPPVGTIKYTWTDTGDQAHQIIRKNYNNLRILATDITYLSFDFPIDNQIIIEVAAGKAKEFTLKGKIALRSKISLMTH